MLFDRVLCSCLRYLYQGMFSSTVSCYWMKCVTSCSRGVTERQTWLLKLYPLTLLRRPAFRRKFTLVKMVKHEPCLLWCPPQVSCTSLLRFLRRSFCACGMSTMWGMPTRTPPSPVAARGPSRSWPAEAAVPTCPPPFTFSKPLSFNQLSEAWT